MVTISQPVAHGVDKVADLSNSAPRPNIDVTLLTGGFDRPYAFGLAMEMTAKGVSIDMIGSDEIESPEMLTTPGLTFLNLQGSKKDANFITKASRTIRHYSRLICYAVAAKPKIFHILWNNKFVYLDRTLLMLFFKALGKKTVFTAHNVNAGKRDGNDSLLNRLTLKIQYRLADHIFVHTEKMKGELIADFGVPEGNVTVIPFGINNSVPDTDLSPAEARLRLGIPADDKTILFFGAIRQYKGLEYLVDAFQQLAIKDRSYRLIIAGEPKRGTEEYLSDIQKSIANGAGREQVMQRVEFIPDSETELYFKAADVSALPYTMVFQSGVLFLSYSFGLPAIASDVGSFADDITSGENGFVCKARDAKDLANVIEKYFSSDLFKELPTRRHQIRDRANLSHSWDVVGTLTRNVYARLLGT